MEELPILRATKLYIRNDLILTAVVQFFLS
jgi:hypothetical protein